MNPKRASRSPRTQAPAHRRDQQEESAFAAILSGLVARVPGARGAALVDRIGETVDYAGRGDPFDVRVAAAHLRLVLDDARAQGSLADVRSLIIRAAGASYVVRSLPDGYALVLCLSRGAGFRGLTRAIPAFAHRLGREAGWVKGAAPWHAVDVIPDERGSPHAIRTNELDAPVEILGRFRALLPEHGRGWRVRLPTGIELTLVRESGGFWYSDESIGL